MAIVAVFFKHAIVAYKNEYFLNDLMFNEQMCY